MPLEGLSSSNAGLHRFATPMESNTHAAQMAQTQAETVIKKVDKKDEAKNDVKDKEKDQEEERKDGYEGRDTEDDTLDEEELEKQLFLSGQAKKFKVKFNHFTDMVELIDKKTGLVLETVSPKDLVNIITKTKGASGILVDREI